MMHMKTDKDTVNEEYALMVGGSGWLIPTNAANSYTLKVSVKGWPSIRDRFDIPSDASPEKTLFDIPKTPIIITTNIPALK